MKSNFKKIISFSIAIFVLTTFTTFYPLLDNSAISHVTYAQDKATKNVSVYIGETGTKYHKSNCRTLARSKNKTKLTLKKAKSKGYKPCKVCNPPS